MSDRRRTDQLFDEIELVASEIDGGLLALASPEAQEEWASVRSRWRGGARRRKVAEDDLALVLTKVRRFGDILRHMKGQEALEA